MDPSRVQLGAWARKIEGERRPRRGALAVRSDILSDEKRRTRQFDDVSGQPTEVAAEALAAAPVPVPVLAAAPEASLSRESVRSWLAARLSVRRRIPDAG